MRTVKELLHSCDREKMVGIYLNLLRGDEDREMEYIAAMAWVGRTLAVSPEISGEYVIVPYYGVCEGKAFLDIGKVRASDIKGSGHAIPLPEDIGSMDTDSIMDLYSSIEAPESYALDFDSNKAILGYEVFEGIRGGCGTEAIMAHIMFEMTFLGYGEEEKREEAERIFGEIGEAMQYIEGGSGRQGQNGVGTQWDSLEAQLFGGDGTEEEKEQSRRRLCIDMLKTRANFAEAVSRIPSGKEVAL